MDNNTVLETAIKMEDIIVIPDECGDTLWDAVLKQEAMVSSIHDSIPSNK